MSEVQEADSGGDVSQPNVVERDSVSSPEEIALAKRRGWADRPDFHDDPGKWKPAKEWLSYGNENNAILRKQVRELENKLAETSKSTSQALEYFKNLENAVKDKNLAQLKEARKKAIADGDGDAFAAAEERIAELTAAQPAPKEDAKPEPVIKPEHIAAFREKEPWINDPVLGRIAYQAGVAIAQQMRDDGEELSGPLILQRVKEKMADLYPHKFASRSSRGGVVEGGGAGGSTRNNGQKGFRDLPQEAQKQAQKFLQQGILKKGKDGADPLEVYARNYFAANQE